MQQSDDQPPARGPLARDWELISGKLRATGKHNEVDIEFARLSFYWGARCAVNAAIRSPAAAIVMMASELRVFDRWVTGKGGDDARTARARGIQKTEQGTA